MKTTLTLIALFITVSLSAQLTMTRQNIGESGCSVLLPGGNVTFELSKSDDGSDVYVGSGWAGDDFEFGIICVKLSTDARGLMHDDQQGMLTGYLDFLKPTFEITEADEYVKELSLPTDASASGVKANWKDTIGNYIPVRGWANANYLLVMYISGKKQYPSTADAERYFNSVELGK